jgi:hypothetical protein
MGLDRQTEATSHNVVPVYCECTERINTAIFAISLFKQECHILICVIRNQKTKGFLLLQLPNIMDILADFLHIKVEFLQILFLFFITRLQLTLMDNVSIISL